MNVLMVCLGNICRSPLAEGILKSKVDSTLTFVDSAGTAGYHVGNPPDSRSIKVAHDYGIDINQQSCRKFTIPDFEFFDVIYVMDKSNYNDIIRLARNKSDSEKVKLLLSEINSKNKEVPDPYHDSDDGFKKVYIMIDKACTVIAGRLENK
jgi:protein-tyrosine phosphatase